MSGTKQPPAGQDGGQHLHFHGMSPAEIAEGAAPRVRHRKPGPARVVYLVTPRTCHRPDLVGQPLILTDSVLHGCPSLPGPPPL